MAHIPTKLTFYFGKRFSRLFPQTFNPARQDDPEGKKRSITGIASAPLWHPPHSHPTCANSLLLESAYSARGDTIGCIRPLCCRFLLRYPYTVCFWHRKAHQSQCGVPCAGLLPEVGISSQSRCGCRHNATLHAPAYFRSCLCKQSAHPA